MTTQVRTVLDALGYILEKSAGIFDQVLKSRPTLGDVVRGDSPNMLHEQPYVKDMDWNSADKYGPQPYVYQSPQQQTPVTPAVPPVKPVTPPVPAKLPMSHIVGQSPVQPYPFQKGGMEIPYVNAGSPGLGKNSPGYMKDDITLSRVVPSGINQGRSFPYPGSTFDPAFGAFHGAPQLDQRFEEHTTRQPNGLGVVMGTSKPPFIAGSAFPERPNVETLSTPKTPGIPQVDVKSGPLPEGTVIPTDGTPAPTTPPVQPSWFQRNQTPLVLGGLGLAGAAGGGLLAHYRNQQDKKKKKVLPDGTVQEVLETEEDTPAQGVKRSYEFPLNHPAVQNMGIAGASVIPSSLVGGAVGAAEAPKGFAGQGTGRGVMTGLGAGMGMGLGAYAGKYTDPGTDAGRLARILMMGGGALGGGMLGHGLNPPSPAEKRQKQKDNSPEPETKPAEKEARFTFKSENCPKCQTAMEGDPGSGSCNSCGHQWGTKKLSGVLFTKRADPLPSFDLGNTSTWKPAERLGSVTAQPLQWAGRQIGTGASETANPLSGVSKYVASNPWASAALIGAPIGAGIGLLGGLTNRKKKRNALGDMLTGGLLGAGAGALGGGAYQLWNGKQEVPPPPQEKVTEAPGVAPGKQIGGGLEDKITNVFTDTPESATSLANLSDANKKLDFSASRADPNSPAAERIQGAAGSRAGAQQDLLGAQKKIPTWLERAGGALGVNQVDPGAEAAASAAGTKFQDATKTLALQLNKLKPSDMTAVPGTPGPDGSRPNIAKPMAGLMGGLGVGGQNTLDFNQHDANMKGMGLSGRARLSDTTGGRWLNRATGNAQSGIDPWAPQEMQPSIDDAIVDPKTLEAFAQGQTPVDPKGMGSFATNTLKNTAGIGALRAGMTQLNRNAFGGSANATNASNMAKGLQKYFDKPPSTGTPRGILNPMKYIAGAGDGIRGLGETLGLTTRTVTPKAFTGNAGALGALTAATGMGNAGSMPTAQQIAQQIQTGKLSPGVQQGLADLGAGKKEINGVKTPVGGRTVDASKFPLTPQQTAGLGAPDSAFGAKTKVTGPGQVKLAPVDSRGLLARQVRPGLQNLGLGALAAGADRLVRGGQHARSLGSAVMGKENDPTDPAVIQKLLSAPAQPVKDLNDSLKSRSLDERLDWVPGRTERANNPGPPVTGGELLGLDKLRDRITDPEKNPVATRLGILQKPDPVLTGAAMTEFLKKFDQSKQQNPDGGR